MGSSNNTAKVGLAVVAAAILTFGVVSLLRSDLFNVHPSYWVAVRFENALGVSKGMSVKMAGSDVGWVEGIQYVDEAQLSEARVRIYEKYHIYPAAKFLISQEGFVGGEKYIDISGNKPSEPGQEPVMEGDVLEGGTQADFNELIANATRVISSVGDALNTERLDRVDKLLSGVTDSMDKINEVLDAVGSLMADNKGLISGSLKNVEAITANFLALSKNLEETGDTVREMADDPRYRDALDGLADNMGLMSDRLTHLTGEIDGIVSDPEFQQNTKDSVRLTKETLEQTKGTIERFQQTMDKVDSLLDKGSEVMDSAGGLMDSAGGAIQEVRGKVEQFSKIGDSVDVKLGLNVRAVDRDENHRPSEGDDYVGDMNLALGTQGKYVQVGADNIGAENNWNFLLGMGELDGFSLKGGVYRGELGLGASLKSKGGLGADVMWYDTKDPKLNAYGYVPVGDFVDVVVGVEDAQKNPTASAGIGVKLN